MRKVFEAIDSYLQILQPPLMPSITTTYSDKATLKVKFEEWAKKNEEAIAAARQAQQKFVTETFALSTLCGVVLQVAYKAIELFSRNTTIPSDLSHLIGEGSKAKIFCCGKHIRGVPVGLVIYAGRNQHMHFDDPDLREPSRSVLDLLASYFCLRTEMCVMDPAFDTENRKLVSLSANITGLIGWRSYDAYIKDMHALLST